MKYLSNLRWVLLVICFYSTGSTTAGKNITQTTRKVTTQMIFGYQFNFISNWGKSKYYEYIRANEIIQLKMYQVKSDETAHFFISNRFSLFKSVFEPKRVSYPGQFSRAIDCPEKYKPKYFEQNKSKGSLGYFLGYANSNKVAGACSDDLIAYKHFYGMLYCTSTQTIIEIEYFTNLDSNSTNQFIDRISCETTLIIK